MANRKNYTDAILEDIQGDIKTILEVVSPMTKETTKIASMKQGLTEIKDDIKMIK